VMMRCSYCGTRRDVQLYGNDPESFPVKRGMWPAGHYICSRCVSIENRRALQGKRVPRLAARLLRVLRRRDRREKRMEGTKE
jgi:hypothetical protein